MEIKKNKMIFNKYKIKKIIYQSKLSAVYEGINVKDNEPVAIKLEKRNKNDFLVNELCFLIDLKGFGIPKIITAGKNNVYNILVEELLGLSLFQLWDFNKQKDIKIKNVCMIALQALDRLEYIHSKNVIHRDLKPENVMIDLDTKKIIYLIDFGFAHKYRSSRTGKHIKYRNLKIICGSYVFSSINGSKGYEQSRKDDLESLGYMLIYLVSHYLPWIDIAINEKIEENTKFKLFAEAKSSTTSEKLCRGLPEEFEAFIKYCRNLEFEQDPNYDYLRSLFTNILTRNFPKNELFFFWIISNPINRKVSKSTEISRYYKRTNSCKKMLYNKIKKSLEKVKKHEKKNSYKNTLILEHRDTIQTNSKDIKDYKNSIEKKEIRKIYYDSNNIRYHCCIKKPAN